MPIKNLVGKKINMLSVIEPLPSRNRKAFFLCLCDCGKKIPVSGAELRNGQKSCGCIKGKRISDARKKNICGEIFGLLVAIKEVSCHKKYGTRWECVCNCGNRTTAYRRDLISGDKKSCGCIVNLKGSSSPNWNNEITDEQRLLRNKMRRHVERYKEWRRIVKEDSNFTCDICNVRGGDLISHHLYSYSDNEELRTDTKNGVCLCRPHHDEFHKKYGRGKNTPEQYYEFRIQKRKENPLTLPTVITYNSVEHPEMPHIRIATYGATQFCTGVHYPENNTMLGVFIPDSYIVSDELLEDMQLKGMLAGPEKNRVKKTKFRGVLSMGIFYGAECEGKEYQRFDKNWREGDIVPESWGVRLWTNPEYVPPLLTNDN